MHDEALRPLTHLRHDWRAYIAYRSTAEPVRWCARADCDVVQIHDGRKWVPSEIKKQNIAIQEVK